MTSNTTTQCEYCQESILIDSKKCRYCGEILTDPGLFRRRCKWFGISFWEASELILVPLILVIIGLSINTTLEARQTKIEDNRERAEILQSYLRDMTTIMSNPEIEFQNDGLGLNNQPLEKQRQIISAIKARTIATTRELDGPRNGTVIVFLAGANILNKLDLSSLNLQGANFSRTYFTDINLIRTDLSGSNLFLAEWERAGLIDANLSEANLSHAIFQDASLSGVILNKANLDQTTFSKTDLSGADLREADLRTTTLPNVLYMNRVKFDDTTQWPNGFVPSEYMVNCEVEDCD